MTDELTMSGDSGPAAHPPAAESDTAVRRLSEWKPEIDSTPEQARFGKFILEEELSRSPNGIVYRARQEDLGRVVALKVLADTDDPLDDRVERFRREVEHVSRLRHPNIVSVFEVGETDGFTWFTMEYVDGVSLSEWLATNGPLGDLEAAELLIKVARAIHYAHTRGIIHRDIKPGNILLDRVTGEPMIVDFGLARDIATDIRITRSGVTMGTPPYMPPEQARGQHDLLDSRSDVYALGATLYETLTGRPPFIGETAVQVMMQVLDKAPTRPRRLRPRIASDLEAIILRCLSKKPRDRYENAELLAADLMRFMRNDWVHARKATVLARFARLLPARRYLIMTLVLLAVVSLQWGILTRGDGTYRPPPTESVPAVTAGPTDTSASWDVLTGQVRSLFSELELDGTAAAGGEARVLYARPLVEPDFEISLTADFRRDPSSEQPPNLAVFIVPDAASAMIPAGDVPVGRGYLLWLGADHNSRAILCRNGREVTFLQESKRGGTRSLRLLPGEYRITFARSGSLLEVEVSGDRRVWYARWRDELPLPMPRPPRFGLMTRGARVAISISEFRHRIRLGTVSGRAEDVGDALFRDGYYREALRYYRQLAAFYRDGNDPEARRTIAARIEAARAAIIAPPAGPDVDLARSLPGLAAGPPESGVTNGTGTVSPSTRTIDADLRRLGLLVAAGRATEAADLFVARLADPQLRPDSRRTLVVRGIAHAADLELIARASWPPAPRVVQPEDPPSIPGLPGIFSPPDPVAPLFPANLVNSPRPTDDPVATARAAVRMLAAARDQFATDNIGRDDQVVDPCLALRVWRNWCELAWWLAAVDPDEAEAGVALRELQARVLGVDPMSLDSWGTTGPVDVPLLGLVLKPDGELWYPDAPAAVLAMTRDLARCLALADAAGEPGLARVRFRLVHRVAFEQLGLRRAGHQQDLWALAREAVDLGRQVNDQQAVLQLAQRFVAVLTHALEESDGHATLHDESLAHLLQIPDELWISLTTGAPATMTSANRALTDAALALLTAQPDGHDTAWIAANMARARVIGIRTALREWLSSSSPRHD